MHPELLVSWFLCILRAVPHYAAYAGNRSYDQLAFQLRCISTSIPSDTVTTLASISRKSIQRVLLLHRVLRYLSLLCIAWINNKALRNGMWVQLPWLCLARQPLFLRRNGKAGLADCCFYYCICFKRRTGSMRHCLLCTTVLR